MSAVQTMVHMPDPPLKIEREYTLGGRETIIIEGVRYDAEYFRTFQHPNMDALYAVERRDDMVMLTMIRNAEDARRFFEEIASASPRNDMEVQDGL